MPPNAASVGGRSTESEPMQVGESDEVGIVLWPAERELPNLTAARSRARQVARRMRSGRRCRCARAIDRLSHHRHRPGAPFTVPFAEADEPTAWQLRRALYRSTYPRFRFAAASTV